MFISRASASIAKPSSATAYAAGDLLANSLTAASVVPLEFSVPGRWGRIHGARIVVQPASGNVVITALDLDLLLFVSAPFAPAGYPADNDALVLTEAQMKDLVAVIPFVTGAWRNPAGALTAGARGWQSVSLSPAKLFSLSGDGTLKGLIQVKGAWTPTAIAQTFTVDLDVEA